MEEDKLYCPHCGSSNLTANKKGFGAGKAITGAVLTGGIGLVAGFIGSGKVRITCLKCGKQMKPGELRSTPLPPKPAIRASQNGCATVLIAGLILSIIASCVRLAL